MAVKIRLQRKGKKKQPFYHIVIADARAPRDGRFIEKIGTYNPLTKPATIEIDRDKAYDWLTKGAQPTDTVRAILRFKGILYRKHLERGVKKGVLTQEEAMYKYQEWIEKKDAKVAARAAKAMEEKLIARAKVAGVDLQPSAPEKVVPKVVVAKVADPVSEPVEVAAETMVSDVTETPTLNQESVAEEEE